MSIRVKKSAWVLLLIFSLTVGNLALWWFYPQQVRHEYVVELLELPSLPVPKQLPLDQSAFTLTAASAYAIDLSSLSTLYSKNPDQPLYPASTIKMMTALVASEHYDLDQELLVSSEATVAGSRAPWSPGQRPLVTELLASLLLASANDSAYVLANHYPGGVPAFVAAMNNKAAQLGLQQTLFVNPAGLDEEGQLSTARDLSIIARSFLRQEFLRQLVATPYLRLEDEQRQLSLDIYNTNQLLGRVWGVKGIKTGTTALAQEALVILIEREGKEILLVLLGSQDRYTDATRLLSWIFNNYEWRIPSEIEYNN